MIKEIACSQKSKDAIIECAACSSICLFGCKFCDCAKRKQYDECVVCLEKNVKWIIVKEGEEV